MLKRSGWKRSPRRAAVSLVGALCVSLALPTAGSASYTTSSPGSADEDSNNDRDADTVPVQLLSITDLHGYFGNYTTGVPGSRAGQPSQQVGGGAYLAAHLERLRKKAGLDKANSLLFSAGDDYSSWPDETEWFWNEPSIEYLNKIGVDFATIGNHELDRNLDYVDHMENGTCQGRPDGDLCFTDSSGKQFQGADFDFYSANVIDASTGDLVAPPYHIQQVSDGNGGTLPVGFIHATTAQTPNEGMSYWPQEQVRLLPEVGVINRYADQLQKQGVEAIVAVMHEGFSQAGGSGYNDCSGPFGPAYEMSKSISSAVDAIVTGHWHAMVNCSLPDPDGNPRPVVQAGNHGRLINEINLELDPLTGDVIRDRTRSVNHPNTRDVPPDRRILAMAEYWRGQLTQRRQEVVGEHTGDLTRTSEDPEESTLANLVADAYLWAGEREGGADLAVSLPGTLLRDLTYDPTPNMAGDAPGVATFAEIFFNLVFENGIGPALVTADVTGRQIDELLESQWQQGPDGSVSFQPVAVSDNVSYRYDPDAPVGERVSYGQVRIAGRPLNPRRTYRIATLSNNLVPRGVRKPFTALLEARKPLRTDYSGGDAVAGYLAENSPVDPPALDRVGPVRWFAARR